MMLDADRDATLSAGVAMVEITPPLEVGLLMSSVEGRWTPFTAVRKPLFARALVLEGASAADPFAPSQRVAIVSLDLLMLSGKALGGFESFKSQIVEAADGVVNADEIVLACTHTHTAPETAALTDLYLTEAFCKWGRSLAESIGRAISAAAAAISPCSLSYGSTTVSGLGIHRRIKTTSGIMMSHPEPPDSIVLSRDGAVDDSVNVLWLRDLHGTLKATVVNATCHPVYEMCNPEVSPDYPGELCSRIETAHPGAIALFLNGAAGNINPRLVSAGASAAQQHAERLIAAVELTALDATMETAPTLVLCRREFSLPSRLPAGENQGVQASVAIVALRVGGVAFAFLPGEPFVETGNEIRSESPFEMTCIVGFAEETIGYVPTDLAFAEGGYETGFGAWSHLAAGCEPVVRENAIALLHETAGVRATTPF